MSTDSDTTRALRSWLEDGPSRDEIPDAVYNAVMDRVPEVRQRRFGWPVLSLPGAQLMTRVAMAAAVVILAVWAGWNAPRGLDFSGVGPSPTSTEDAQAAIRSTLRFWSGRPILPGTYYVDDPFPLRIEVTIPAGLEVLNVVDGLSGLCWQSCETEPAGIDFWIVENAHADPCNLAAGTRNPPLGPSVDDFVQHLGAIERVRASEPMDVTLGGYDGRYLELVTDASAADCTDGGVRLFYINPGQQYVRPGWPGFTDRFWVLDVDGTRLVIDLFSSPDTPETVIADLRAAVESIRIEGPSGTSAAPTN